MQSMLRHHGFKKILFLERPSIIGHRKSFHPGCNHLGRNPCDVIPAAPRPPVQTSRCNCAEVRGHNEEGAHNQEDAFVALGEALARQQTLFSSWTFLGTLDHNLSCAARLRLIVWCCSSSSSKIWRCSSAAAVTERIPSRSSVLLPS